MSKIWLNSYPPGIRPEIDLNECASINAMLAAACRRFSRLPAFRNLGTTITYAQLDRLSRDFGAFLQSLAGLRRGSRVALMMPNILQYPVAFHGVLRAGMIAVNVNPLYTARELEQQLADSGAEAIVILENFARVLEKALPNTPIRHVVITRIGDLLAAPRRWLANFVVKRVKKMVPAWHIGRSIQFRQALRRGRARKLEEPVAGHGDIALLQYTGGTTGTSKGAVLTHGNLVASLLQFGAWYAGTFEEGREIVVTALPLYHIFSLSANCLFGTKAGALRLLITNPRDTRGFVRELRSSGFSVLAGVNTLFNALLNTPGFAELDFRNLKPAVSGGSPLHGAVAERWKAVTGCLLTNNYGLTEAMPVSLNPPGAEYTGFTGLPCPSTEVCILDDRDCELPPGREGEICVRGPQVTPGYWRKPDETRAAFTADGWFRTGDIGLLDERGHLRITDRKKDMIIVSGFKVYPAEVEDVIAAVPGVLECGVIGVPDPATGEAVKAFIVRATPELSAEAVVAFCRQRLTNYKVPKLVEFRGELPKSPIGKVLRLALRSI